VPEILIIFYAIATGYVASGLIASFYQLVTDKPASFQSVPDGMVMRLVTVPVLMFGGPAILLRNAVRGRLIEGRPVIFLGLSALIAASWSFISGLIVLQFALFI